MRVKTARAIMKARMPGRMEISTERTRSID
jgi:hypothetical protein